MPEANCVAVLGTGSDVGKSIVSAALCRIFSDAGIKVAPFKSQNMSNNSFVTADGDEMGRAQVVQAECARLEPAVCMNPLLLKPTGNCRSQIVLNGKVMGETTSDDFRRDRTALFDEVMKSLKSLRQKFELVVIEGAGSCAEVNLKNYDIANFRTALAAGASVILVADIDRGGVFAQVIGTLGLLRSEEKKLVKGIVVNKFRGDASLFDDGRKILEEKTGLPVLGLIPFFDRIKIDDEDSLLLENFLDPKEAVREGKINIAVIRLPHVSNFTDFGSLSSEPSVNLSYLSQPVALDKLDAVIIPGTKNVRGDMRWLSKTGWSEKIKRFADGGGTVCGVCGGYQMLGQKMEDPHGIEGEPGGSAGLLLLDVFTSIKKEKRLGHVRGKLVGNGARLSGYEIHMGETILSSGVKPFLRIETKKGKDAHFDGAVNDRGNVFGTYLHGLFDEPEYRKSFLKSLNRKVDVGGSDNVSLTEFKERQYDMLAEHFRKHLDVGLLFEIASASKPKVARREDG